MNKPKFIVIEGGEGAGKGTMIRRARELFGDSLVLTREPGGSPYAEEIRRLALNTEGGKHANAHTQFGLVWAARADHLKSTIRPALDAGKHVLCDRFDSSTWTYQICGQEGEELKDLFFQVRALYLGDTAPDLYIYLDVDPAIGLARRKAEEGAEVNHFDERPLEFHQKVRAGYLDFLTKVPSRIINAERPLEAVVAEFDSVIQSLLKVS